MAGPAGGAGRLSGGQGTSRRADGRGGQGVTAAASAGIYFLRGDISPFIAAPVALGILLGTVARVALSVLFFLTRRGAAPELLDRGRIG